MKKFITTQALIDAAHSPVVSYEEASRLTGGMVSKKTLQNLASLGECPERIRIGSRVGFRTKDFAEWFVGRLEKV